MKFNYFKYPKYPFTTSETNLHYDQQLRVRVA